ncbi:MAG: ABC transporter ATP-binding protein [Bacteroidales bacterium]|nr:ABC transporter ATP-binding protein [Bacteroidales bacterium]
MVEINNISKNYGKVKALDNVSFTVNTGELFGLIGPDGAGKTSLLRIITTLILANSGSVKVFGLDVVKDYKKIRNITGYMPGKFSLYQDLSVEENLSFFASVFGTTIQENYHLIKDIYVQIEPFKTRPAGKLSGGMKQKLALSCALIHKPEILVLDEPTTGVDAVSRKEFWAMLKNLKKIGITIIVSTPYMDEAALCDRVALIQQGKILDLDSPEGIINRNIQEIFEVSAKDMYRLKNDISSYENTQSVFLFGRVLHYSPKNESSAKDLEEYLKNKGHLNLKIEKGSPGIEDCFMKLMNTNG